jgi:murein DD-endopeptidase MepM/ murein hydrolase activator NlpD
VGIGLSLAGLLRLAVAGALLAAAHGSATAHPEVRVTWHPPAVRPGEVTMVIVRGTGDAAILEGAVAGRPLAFFPYADGMAAVAGVDLGTRPGRHQWKIAVGTAADAPRLLTGTITVKSRQFVVQRLTLPPGLVDLDAETTRRAETEADRLRTLYRTITPERLWRGRFIAPVSGAGPGEGFGARRVINGKPRAPHSGLDYAAEPGTAVVAANAGRVALVADFFFPGRLVVLDHGLGLYTLYFHLQRALVGEGDGVDRGQPIGEVGATGRATGPHLHFGVHIGAARVDPAALLGLGLAD